MSLAGQTHRSTNFKMPAPRVGGRAVDTWHGSQAAPAPGRPGDQQGRVAGWDHQGPLVRYSGELQSAAAGGPVSLPLTELPWTRPGTRRWRTRVSRGNFAAAGSSLFLFRSSPWPRPASSLTICRLTWPLRKLCVLVTGRVCPVHAIHILHEITLCAAKLKSLQKLHIAIEASVDGNEI